MLWGGEVVDAYVGTQQMVLWRGRQGLGAYAVEEALPNLAAGLKGAGISPRRWQRTRLRVWLSGALARPFVVLPVGGLRNWREALAAAAAKAADETGWAEPAAVWLDSLPRQHPALGVAAAAPTVEALKRTAGRAGVRLLSIRPWWALALDEVRASGEDFDLLAAEDTDALVLLSAGGEQWREAAAYAPAPVAEQAEAVVQRRAMAQGVGVERMRRARLSMPGADGTFRSSVAVALVQSFALEPK